jgi:hypothetical protein
VTEVATGAWDGTPQGLNRLVSVLQVLGQYRLDGHVSSRATNDGIVNQASSHLEAVGTGLFDTPRGTEIVGFGRLTQREQNENIAGVQ